MAHGEHSGGTEIATNHLIFRQLLRIKLLFAQLEKLTAYLKKQQVEVEVMRESVQLQAQAARRVLAKRESIISELGDGIAIALEEVTPPPISECELKEPVLRA